MIPDPPVAGQAVDVIYVGPEREVEYQVDGLPPVRLRVGRGGRLRIERLPSGRALMLSDNLGLPGYIHREIVEAD